jgi:hypothetical protein
MKMTSIFEADVRRLFSGWRIWWLGVRPPIAFISTCDMIFLAAESSTGDAFELFTHAGNSWNVQSSSATVDCNGMIHRAPAPATMIFCGESSGPEYTPIMVREGGFASTGGDLGVCLAARISGERQAKACSP